MLSPAYEAPPVHIPLSRSSTHGIQIAPSIYLEAGISVPADQGDFSKPNLDRGL